MVYSLSFISFADGECVHSSFYYLKKSPMLKVLDWFSLLHCVTDLNKVDLQKHEKTACGHRALDPHMPMN